MKTVLVTTSYLLPQKRYDRLLQFINFYKKDAKVPWDLVVLDNASPIELSTKIIKEVNLPFNTISFKQHFDRPTFLDYKYLWRAVHTLQTLFKDYDKVVYMDNDFYILKQGMIDYINNLTDGWTTFWCSQYRFPETGCHIVTKDCKEYLDFVNCSLDEFFEKHNTKLMEDVLPVTRIEKKFIGDRYGEAKQPQTPEMDYYAQNFQNVQLKFGL